MFIKFRDSVSTFYQQPKYRDGLQRGKLRECWPAIVGKLTALHTYPCKLNNHCLVIVCDAPIWIQELQLQSSLLVARINKLVNEQLVKEIHCQLGKLEPSSPRPKPASRQLPAIAATNISSELQQQIQEDASTVKDLGVQTSIVKLRTFLAKRRELALAQGAKPCAICGEPSKQQVCDSCLSQKRQNDKHALYRHLNIQPWLDYEQLKLLVPGLERELYIQGRNHLCSQLRRNAWIFMNSLQPGQSLPAQLRTILIDLAVMTTNLPPEQLTEAIIKRALKPMLAQAYISDQVCESNYPKFID